MAVGSVGGHPILVTGHGCAEAAEGRALSAIDREIGVKVLRRCRVHPRWRKVMTDQPFDSVDLAMSTPSAARLISPPSAHFALTIRQEPGPLRGPTRRQCGPDRPHGRSGPRRSSPTADVISDCNNYRLLVGYVPDDSIGEYGFGVTRFGPRGPTRLGQPADRVGNSVPGARIESLAARVVGRKAPWMRSVPVGDAHLEWSRQERKSKIESSVQVPLPRLGTGAAAVRAPAADLWSCISAD